MTPAQDRRGDSHDWRDGLTRETLERVNAAVYRGLDRFELTPTFVPGL